VTFLWRLGSSPGATVQDITVEATAQACLTVLLFLSLLSSEWPMHLCLRKTTHCFCPPVGPVDWTLSWLVGWMDVTPGLWWCIGASMAEEAGSVHMTRMMAVRAARVQVRSGSRRRCAVPVALGSSHGRRRRFGVAACSCLRPWPLYILQLSMRLEERSHGLAWPAHCVVAAGGHNQSWKHHSLHLVLLLPFSIWESLGSVLGPLLDCNFERSSCCCAYCFCCCLANSAM